MKHSAFLTFAIVLAAAFAFCTDARAEQGQPTKTGKKAFTLWQVPTQVNTIGNCYVIRTDNGKTIVIDGGVKDEVSYVRGFLGALGNHVDLWIITHPHDDHEGALKEILKNPRDIKIDELYQSTLSDNLLNTEKDSKSGALDYYDCVKKSGIKTVEAKEGDVMKFGHTTIKVFSVADENVGYDYNCQSIVMKISDPYKSVLIMGDCGAKESEKLLAGPYKNELDCDYMQMAHHGQNGATMQFYRTVKFKAAMWPTPSWVYNNDNGNLKTMETRATVKELNIKWNYISYQGLVKIE